MEHKYDILALIGKAYEQTEAEEVKGTKAYWLRRQYDHAYGLALADALEKGSTNVLQKMLRDEIRVPDCMLPLIADVIARPLLPQKAGIKSTFNSAYERLLYRHMRHMVQVQKKRITHVYIEFAESFSLPEHTLKRIWRKHRKLYSAEKLGAQSA